MIDKVMIDGQQVELTKDMFEMAPANFGDNEAISRPSLTFWQDARKRLFKKRFPWYPIWNTKGIFLRLFRKNISWLM